MNWTVNKLEELGRTKLSDNFFMRDFLHSEISQIEGIPNIPDDPQLAIQAGSQLCQEVLDPLQNRFGRITIRSGFRSCAVNAKGAENRNQYRCARNEANYAAHIWDRRDAQGFMGATACIVVPSFLPYFKQTGDWTAIAWWIHDHIPAYASLYFFPKLCAFNIQWHEDPNFSKSIRSYIKNPHTGDKKALTKRGMSNFDGDHRIHYSDLISSLEK